jgi:SAM-dependent methyltransferase
MDPAQSPKALGSIYSHRFGDSKSRHARETTWSVLSEKWFPRFIHPEDTVLELGAGGCEFINSVGCARKIAVDLIPGFIENAKTDVETIIASAQDLPMLADDAVDVVFSSNFFEHLPSHALLIEVLNEARRVLRPGGKLITLMSNPRVVGGEFWDFIDHSLPLTDRSLNEALTLCGFVPEVTIPRFLPYTAVDSNLPVSKFAVRSYLAFRPAWRFLGGQLFSVARST